MPEHPAKVIATTVACDLRLACQQNWRPLCAGMTDCKAARMPQQRAMLQVCRTQLWSAGSPAWNCGAMLA